MKKQLFLSAMFALFSILARASYDYVDGQFGYALDAVNMTATVGPASYTITGDIEIPHTLTYRNHEFTVTGVTTIWYTPYITSFYMHDMTTGGDLSFYGCTSLKKAVFNNVNNFISFEDCDSLIQVDLRDMPSCPTFKNCQSLQTINWDQNLKNIGYTVPIFVSQMVDIRYGDTDTIPQIPYSCFDNCPKLDRLNVPSNVNCVNAQGLLARDMQLSELDLHCERLQIVEFNANNTFDADRLKIGPEFLSFDFIMPGLCARDSYDSYTWSENFYGEPYQFNCRQLIIEPSEKELYSCECRIKDWRDDGQYEYYRYSGSLHYLELQSLQNLYCGRSLTDLQIVPAWFLNTLTIGTSCINIDIRENSLSKIDTLCFEARTSAIPGMPLEEWDIKRVESRSALPPACPNEFSSNTYMNGTLYVPVGSLAAYQNAEIWKKFWEIKETDFASVEDISLDSNHNDRKFVVDGNTIYDPVDAMTHIDVFDLQGRLVASAKSRVVGLNRGVYIATSSTGHRQKIIIKD